MIVRPSGSPLRVGQDVARLLRLLDGTRDVQRLASELGGPWTEEDVSASLRKLAEMEVLASAELSVAPRRSRLSFTPPATIRFALFLKPSFPVVVAHLTRAIPRGTGETLLFSIGFLGLGAFAFLGRDLTSVLSTPLPFASLLTVLGMLTLGTVVHELAHSVALARRGGIPGPYGVMLLYLVPAAFAEVTDMWRLPRRRDRLAVALAGISIQAGVAGVSAFAALWTGGGARSTLVALSLASYVSAAVNAFPFVKLDGYVALLAITDAPRLRERSMSASRAAIDRALLSVRASDRAPGEGFLALFGFIAALSPIAILLFVLIRLSAGVAVLGAWGKAIVVVIGTYLLIYAAWRVLRWVRDGVRAGASPLRASVTIVALSTLVVLSGFLPIERTISAGFSTSTDGTMLLVHPDQSVIRDTCGHEVELRSSGLVSSQILGTTTVAQCEVQKTEAPLEALAAVRMDATVPAFGVPLTPVADLGVAAGSAIVRLDTVTMYRWLLEW